MAKRLKTIKAGRLVVVGCYTIPTPRSTDRERAALREISSAAQDRVNMRRSFERLELLIAANFGRHDLHVVFTYDDEHLPENRPAAVKLLKKMITQLRAVRKSRGQETRYIYVTEQLSSEGGRLHHHMVLNGTGADLEVLQSLWPYGGIELENIDDWEGYECETSSASSPSSNIIYRRERRRKEPGHRAGGEENSPRVFIRSGNQV